MLTLTLLASCQDLDELNINPNGVDPERAFQAEGNGGFSQGVERYNVNPWVIPIGFKVGFTF